MTDESLGLRLGWPMAVVGGIALLAAGVLLGGRFSRSSERPSLNETSSMAGMPVAEGESPTTGSMADQDRGVQNGAGATVMLTPELMRRAGIEIGAARTTVVEASLRLPGRVEANAYRSVSVTPLVAGRITEVEAELGDRVTRGDTMARVYSPELARAQTMFLATRAEFAAHQQQHRRTERLVQIGASSQQELEHVAAEALAMRARTEADRSALELFGLSPSRIEQLATSSEVSALADIPAPIDGVVLERRVNAGLNVDPSMPLFTVVDLSSVWVVAELYERDFAAVQEGSLATVTAGAYPGFQFSGRVSYIDPQVQSETRTAGLRIEVPNADGRLRLGMYVEANISEDTDSEVVVVPADALQALGDRYVVYVPGNMEGMFREQEVRVGRRWDDLVEVESGLVAGDDVVVGGAFFLRAERERVSPGADASAAETH